MAPGVGMAPSGAAAPWVAGRVASRPPTVRSDVLPDPFDVLEATLGADVRVVEVAGARVVRSSGRTEHAPANAVHHPAAPATLDDALHDLVTRFPTSRRRVVVPWHEGLAREAAGRDGVAASRLDLLLADGTPPTGTRTDLRIAPPADDRAWHGITVLLRHAAAPGEDRSRGAEDDRLRREVAGWRELVEHGRARVLRAERFGTPVAAGVLHWVPAAPVAEGHAGLAVVSDVVVHPAHRGLGVARSVVAALVERHLADFPRAQVAAVAGPSALTTGPPVEPRGWHHHAALLACEVA